MVTPTLERAAAATYDATVNDDDEDADTPCLLSEVLSHVDLIELP